MEARSQWSEIFNMLREDNCHQVNIYFKNEDEVKVHSDLRRKT